jgi:hypothetical protein
MILNFIEQLMPIWYKMRDNSINDVLKHSQIPLYTDTFILIYHCYTTLENNHINKLYICTEYPQIIKDSNIQSETYLCK